jgi:hypothetical protein
MKAAGQTIPETSSRDRKTCAFPFLSRNLGVLTRLGERVMNEQTEEPMESAEVMESVRAMHWGAIGKLPEPYQEYRTVLCAGCGLVGIAHDYESAIRVSNEHRRTFARKGLNNGE